MSYLRFNKQARPGLTNNYYYRKIIAEQFHNILENINVVHPLEFFNVQKVAIVWSLLL